MKKILIRGARQLVTLHGPKGPRRGAAAHELGIIQDGSILISNGLVECAGPTRRVENLAEARTATEIDAAGRIVIPGFVDCHTHLVSGAWRLADYETRIAGADYRQVAAAGGGVLSSVRAVRDLPGKHLAWRARQCAETMLRHGTTALEAKSGYGLDEAGELKSLRVATALDGKPLDIVSTYLGAHAVPTEYEGRADDYVDWMCTYMLPLIRRRKLARFVDVCCDRGTFAAQQARRYLEAAKALGFGLRIHAEQFSNSAGIRLAVELGAVSADHLVHADSTDVDLLAQSETIATLLPGAVFHLGSDRYPPARALLDRGAAVALATGFNPGTSPTSSMPMILSLACANMRMTPAEALTAATLNAAHTVGLAHKIGSLEPGKQADLLVCDVPDYREIPYRFGVNLVHTVMKRGEIVYEQSRVQWADS
jgi:imidazolonepropionase